MEKISVLLVDDEVDVLEVLCLRLERRGMSVHTADSAEKAFAILKDTPVQVVLLDVKMPGMDGITALVKIREMCPKTAVIMLSGHADMEVAARGLQLGAFSYLLKPVDIETLSHKIEDACHQIALDDAAS